MKKYRRTLATLALLMLLNGCAARVANRNWTGWCKNPYITYIEDLEE